MQTFLPRAAASPLGTSFFEIRVRLDTPPDLRTSGNASPRFLPASSVQPFIALTILLNHLLQIVRHFRKRFQSNFHATVFGLSNDGIYLREARSEQHTSELQSPCNLVC